MMRTIFLPLLAATVLSLPAQSREVEIVQELVPTHDLDLASADDRDVLDERIRVAVDRVCRPASPISQYSVVRCRERSFKDAMKQVEAHLIRTASLARADID